MQRPSEAEQEWMDAMAEELGATQAGFQVRDVRGAEWCLTHIARATARMAETQQEYARLTERYARWREQRHKEDKSTIERMESFLRPYFDQLKAAGKVPHDRKSVHLPSGTIGERWHDVEWERDEKALLPWAKAQGLVRLTEAPQWDEIKKQIALSADGRYAVIRREVIDEQTGEVTVVEDVVPGVRPSQLAGHVFYVSAIKEDV